MGENREFHAVAEVFPLLRGQAFQELAADIKQNGLREPILVDAEGRIVDGRNRYRACLAAGVEPHYVEWQGQGELAEVVLSLNLHRRHLNESQRALVAARLAKLLEKEAAQRRGARTDIQANLPGSSFGQARDQAGARVNVSARSVTHARKVLRDGSDELIAAVESGDLAVSTAALLAGRPKQEQAQALARGAKHAAGKAREIRAGRGPAPSGRSCPGSFGVFGPGNPEESQTTFKEDVIFLWVAAGGLGDAIEALQERGFRYAR